jgi:hypothetical protein
MLDDIMFLNLGGIDMSKYGVSFIWDKLFANQSAVYDYAGRRMEKSAIGNPQSNSCPTIDHIRPLSHGGKDCLENIVLCNRITNQEKSNNFPHWTANGKRFLAKRVRGTSNEYDIYQL